MDTGKHKDDFTFYSGYEGEKEIIITYLDISYHIWDGYFEDIFGNPIYENDGWTGFTRDYNEYINAFADDCIESAIMPSEYLNDARLYVNRSFSYDETSDVLNCLIRILEKANDSQDCILVRVN